jgi:hypothetical protein
MLVRPEPPGHRRREEPPKIPVDERTGQRIDECVAQHVTV